MTDQLTPEQIQQEQEKAQMVLALDGRYPVAYRISCELARAVLDLARRIDAALAIEATDRGFVRADDPETTRWMQGYDTCRDEFRSALTAPSRDVVDVSELAEACDQYRAAYWVREDRTPGLVDNLAAPIARLRAVLALTEQLEPPQRESSLAQRIAAQCTCEYPYPRDIWAGHHPNCATEQQPEPVSRSELFDLVANGTCGECQNYLTDQLLSRYTITRKQPEGDNHGA